MVPTVVTTYISLNYFKLLYQTNISFYQVLEAAGFGRYHIFFMIVLGMMSFADAAEIFMGKILCF